MLNLDKKRRWSETEDDLTAMPAKKSVAHSIKNYVLGAFGFKEKPQPPKLINDTPSLKRTATVNTGEPNITAKQLHNYYLTLKNENSSLFNDLAEMKTSTRANPELDSFIMNNKDAESTMIKEQLNSVNGSSNKESDIILPSAGDSNKTALTTVYNDSILPDPLERANLIQLKKMMELDRYRKLRMNYLRKHTRHLDRSGIAKMAKDLKEKKKMATPIKSIKDVPVKRRNTSGIFGISMLNKLAQDYEDEEEDEEEELRKERLKSLKVEPSTISQKLKFNSKSQLDELDTVNKRKTIVPERETKLETKESEPTQTIPKFASSLNEDTGPSSGFSFGGSAPSLNTPKISESKPMFGTKRKVTIENLVDNDEVKAEKNTFNFGKADGKSTDATAFSFGKSSEKKEESKPSFSFGVSNGSKVSETTTSAPEFKFSGSASEKKEESKQTFSFGAPAAEKKEEPNKPAFSFDASTTEKKEETNKPAFSFGTPVEKKEDNVSPVPAPSFSFSGSKTTEKQQDQPNFGISLDQNAQKKESKPAAPFSFNTTKTDKPKEVTSTFSFGASAEKADASATTTPAFSLGTSTSKNEETATPLFSTGEKKEESKPAFSFGGGSEKKENKPTTVPATTPSFSFGGMSGSSDYKPPGTTALTPSFSFGQSSEKKEETKPSFSFGQTTGKKDDKPAFSFGSGATVTEKKDTTPAFSFGHSTENANDNDDNDRPTKRRAGLEAAPGASFSFGQTSNIKKDESAPVQGDVKAFKFETSANDPPAFSKMGMNNLGVPAKPKPTTSGFSFGENQQQSSSSNNMFGGNSDTKPAFGFGMNKPAEEKKDTPSFGFNPQSNNGSSNNFSFGNNGQASNNNNNPSGFSFESNNASTSGFGQAPTQQPTTGNMGFGFGSGPASAVTSGGNTPNTFNFGGTNNNNNNGNAAAKIFNMNNSNFSSGPQASSGGFGMNQGFTGANAGPPNMNFTGGQAQMDPSMVFQAGGSATPPSGPRKKAQLRRRTGRR